MKKAIFPGTFDPPTCGHIDIIKRTLNFCDLVYVAIGENLQKKGPKFTLTERLSLLNKSTSNITNVKIVSFSGLLADFMKKEDIDLVIRGVRNVEDFNYELQQAKINKKLNENIETLLIFSEEKYCLVSSSVVKELAILGKTLHGFIPNEIEKEVFNKLSN